MAVTLFNVVLKNAPQYNEELKCHKVWVDCVFGGKLYPFDKPSIFPKLKRA